MIAANDKFSTTVRLNLAIRLEWLPTHKGEWKTGPSLYMLLIGRPGLGKTPPLDFIYKPIYEQDDIMYDKYVNEWNEYEKALASSGNRCTDSESNSSTS